jgi:hypothetical protein
MTLEALAGLGETLPDEQLPGKGLPDKGLPGGQLPGGHLADKAIGAVLEAATVAAAPAIDGAFAGRGVDGGADGPSVQTIGVRMIDGGIIEVLLPANQEIEGPEARIAGDTVRSLAAGRRMPVLLVITGVVGVSMEARQVYSGSIAATAFALVGESPVDRVIAHYLLRSKSETIPAQFFTSESAAVEWLRQYTREE